jgi:CheY-like chemotaxis protein
MQGKIELNSVIGEGSCFTVLIPLEVTALAKLAKKEAINQEEQTSAIAQDFAHFRVLLVEDDAIAAVATKMNLNRFGCDVDWAKSGQEAVEMITKEDYALVFMDIGLPDQSGIEVAREIRALKDAKKARISIVALTGHGGGKSRQVCLDAGMQSVLSKPANLADLKKAIDYFAGNHSKHKS